MRILKSNICGYIRITLHPLLRHLDHPQVTHRQPTLTLRAVVMEVEVALPQESRLTGVLRYPLLFYGSA